VVNVVALVDFSDITDEVVQVAARLTPAAEGHLYLVHVASAEPEFVGYDVGPQAVRNSIARQYHQEHQQLEAMAAGAREKGLTVTPLLVPGMLLEKAVEETTRLEPDWVVVGSHGHRALYELLVGSVTEAILRAAPCPVVVVPVRRG